MCYYVLLITIETGMEEARGTHASTRTKGFRLGPWQQYKKLLNRMTKEELNKYRDVEVSKIKDKGGVVSKGYYKLEYLLSGVSKIPRTVLELGGGAGGMTQFLTPHKRVKRVNVMNLITLCSKAVKQKYSFVVRKDDVIRLMAEIEPIRVENLSKRKFV